jgi:hypothetical protein
MDRLAAVLAVLAVLALAGCRASLPEGPVCGLHSASAPVTAGDRTLAVGAKVLGPDKLKAKGWALLECFSGGIRVLHDESVTAGRMREAQVQIELPHRALRAGKVEEIDALPQPVVARYSDNRFTPGNAGPPSGVDDTNYLMAFFTPNGFAQPAGSATVKLPAPPNRPRVPFIHAGDLGEGDATLEVRDDVVFAETDDLATAALVEGKTYRLGRAVRLILPDGAEAKLNGSVKLEGPMDLKLR